MDIFQATFETGGDFITSLTFDANGKRLATSHKDGTIRVFDIATQVITHEIKSHHLQCRQVHFSKDDNLLFSCSDDRQVTVVDTHSGRPVNSFSHSGMVLCVDPSSDDRHFLAGCADKKVVLWDLGMQRCVEKLDSQHSDQVWGVKFSPDGKMAVSVGDDSLVQLYDMSR